jgi:hypothetical protein
MSATHKVTRNIPLEQAQQKLLAVAFPRTLVCREDRLEATENEDCLRAIATVLRYSAERSEHVEQAVDAEIAGGLAAAIEQCANELNRFERRRASESTSDIGTQRPS